MWYVYLRLQYTHVRTFIAIEKHIRQATYCTYTHTDIHIYLLLRLVIMKNKPGKNADKYSFVESITAELLFISSNICAFSYKLYKKTLIKGNLIFKLRSFIYACLHSSNI